MIRSNAWVSGALVFMCTAFAVWAFSNVVLMNAHAGEPASAQIKYEPGEEFPGGDATSKKSSTNRNAFSHPSGNLTFKQQFQFRLGNGIFRKLWVSAPASTKSSDGLGPHFNARACQRCHLKDGRGHPPEGPDDNFVSMLFRVGVPASLEAEKEALKNHLANTFPDPVYGGQIQDFAIQGHKSEAKPSVWYEEMSVKLNGNEIVHLRKPTYSFNQLAHGPMAPNVMISPRVANQMIGLGLLEAIPREDLEKRADPDDTDGDGVSGRANLVWDVRKNKVTLGRFGWKAGQPSVLQQSAAAFLGDMGLSTTLFAKGQGDCTAAQAFCVNAPHGAEVENDGVEVTDKMLDLVGFYARNLAVPKRLNAKDPNVLKGKALFHNAGCASCHTPKHVTDASVDTVKAFRGQTIWPYTDLLLHDMGPDLADGFTEGVASGSEWRTPPLWGIGQTKKVSGHTHYLHDGRARNLLVAILWHGGEAEAAKQAVIDMQPDERQLLLAFLNDKSSIPIPFSRKEKLAGEIITGHIVPRYQALHLAVTDLETQVEKTCRSEGPGLSNNDVQTAFRQALISWMGVQHIDFGPAVKNDRHYRFQYWPDKHSRMGRQLKQLLSRPLADIPDSKKIGEMSVALQGLPAIEQILFLQKTPSTDERAKQCKLLAAMSGNLAAISEDTLNEWKAYKPKDRAAVVDRLVHNMMEQLQIITALKIERPLGDSLENARPKRSESWRSGMSYKNIAANYAALAELFSGNDHFSGLRIALTGSEENTGVAKAIAELLSYGTTLAGEQSTKLSDDVTDEKGRKRAKFMAVHTQSVQEFVGEYLFPALGVQSGFNAQDGD